MVMPNLCELQVSREKERKKQKDTDTPEVVCRDS